MIRVGSARIDENGDIHSGKAGDQTSHECETQDWYLHAYGWVVIRPKNVAVGEKIAQDMIYICDNPAIGYDQWQDQTLYNAAKPYGFNASMVTTPCETDCAKAVRVCVLYAGIDCPDFWTGNEITVLEKTGAFDVIRDPEYTEHWERLRKGDILCTPKAGHTVVVLDDGPLAYADGEDGAAMYQATHNVWLRTGPSTDYAHLIVIPAGKVMTATGKIIGNWAEGEYMGVHGWASLKYLKVYEPKTLVTTGTARLRKDAGTIYPTLRFIPAGSAVVPTGNEKKVLGTIWYEVIYDGSRGWVSGKLVK